MSSTVTVTPARGVRGIGLVSIIAGIVLILAGIGTWIVVSNQLSAEEITVSDDASFMAGRHVNGPLTAYAQAEVINKHALEASGGQTYAELDQDDPTRQTVMTASFLRASLFTSVVAFGVAALVVGLGILFLLLGLALRKLAGGPSVAVETPAAYTSGGDMSGVGRHVDPASAPAAPVAPTAPPVTPTTPVAPGRTSALSTPAAEARAAAASTAEPTGAPGTGTPSAPGASPEAAPQDPTPPSTTHPTTTDPAQPRPRSQTPPDERPGTPAS
jgi:hypothetical protein